MTVAKQQLMSEGFQHTEFNQLKNPPPSPPKNSPNPPASQPAAKPGPTNQKRLGNHSFVNLNIGIRTLLLHPRQYILEEHSVVLCLVFYLFLRFLSFFTVSFAPSFIKKCFQWHFQHIILDFYTKIFLSLQSKPSLWNLVFN